MRLVLDTNVVASALLWGGAPRLLLQAGREKRIELLTSLALLAELTDIPGGTQWPTGLYVFRGKTCVLGNSGKHARSNLFAVVKCENEVGPAFTRQGAV